VRDQQRRRRIGPVEAGDEPPGGGRVADPAERPDGDDADLAVPVVEQPAELGYGGGQLEVAEDLRGSGPAYPAAVPQIPDGLPGDAAAQEDSGQGIVRLPAELAEQREGAGFGGPPGVVGDGDEVVAAVLAVVGDEGEQRPARTGGQRGVPALPMATAATMTISTMIVMVAMVSIMCSPGPAPSRPGPAARAG
jgi:hypothetical protein